MRKLFTFAILFVAIQVSAQEVAPPAGYCNVIVCNKLSRFSLDPWSHIKDKMGEICAPSILWKEDAVVGNVLNKESRWYQGSFNLTKSSVTKVKEVRACTPVPPPPAASQSKS